MPSDLRLAKASLVLELMKSRSMHSQPISSTFSVLRAETPQSPTSQPPTPLAAKLSPFC